MLTAPFRYKNGKESIDEVLVDPCKGLAVINDDAVEVHCCIVSLIGRNYWSRSQQDNIQTYKTFQSVDLHQLYTQKTLVRCDYLCGSMAGSLCGKNGDYGSIT